MAVVGADSKHPITQDIVEKASQRLGFKPAFWGRYFKGPSDPSEDQFHAAHESAVLKTHGIHVLPVARQTKHVGGTFEQGKADGAGNAAAVLEAFGKDETERRGGRITIFLDVEGDPDLSADYYRGWAEGVTSTSRALAPAVYGPPPRYAATYQALSAAIAAGAECRGVWVARYPHAQFDSAPNWQEELIRSEHLPANVPILGWQFVENVDGLYDFNLVNPSFEAEFAAGLAQMLPAVAPIPAPAPKTEPPAKPQSAPPPAKASTPTQPSAPAPQPPPPVAPAKPARPMAPMLVLLWIIMRMLFGARVPL
ncbi:MAG: hypothetical protein ABUL73_05395 [Alphaproteobacteria bacterium]